MSSTNGGPGRRAGRPAARQIQTWQAAEHNAAAWMRHWGFDDAKARPGGADGGVDVVSRRALGQVKFQASSVGRPELQRLFGARGKAMDKQLLFFTGSSYAATALSYAEENDIALFVYGLDGAMRPVNAVARRIGAAPAAAPRPVATPATAGVPADDIVRSEARPPRPASTAPSAKSTGRTLALAFLALVALGGLASVVDGATGPSSAKDSTSMSAEQRVLEVKAFEDYAAAHGSPEQQDAVRHVVRIEAVDSPYSKIHVHTDYPRATHAYTEGRLISELFGDYLKARDQNGNGYITVYGDDASVPLAYAMY
ncbi:MULTISPECIES: restriction endonuclease [Streptomyces]|uniref:restriction endonuclease n=1 Tax=Streptomyces TaxID=1883 RepID=UPI001FE8545F|nr:restriction endonuclease [Streptomyces glaucescens]